MRRIEWRSIPALAVGFVCLWLVGGVVWAMRPVWLALGRSAVSTFEWEACLSVAMTLGLSVAARYASHVLDELREHRWRLVGCLGRLVYRATRMVMWFALVVGALMTVIWACVIVGNALVEAVGA